MKLTRLNDKLLEIEKIKNIRSIELQDLFVHGEDSKELIVPGFIIIYENGKYLYLTTHDEYFIDFVRKIRETYLEEKDNILFSDGLFTKRLEIDDLTRRVLESGTFENASELYHFYQKKDGYKDSLLFEEDNFNNIFSIVSYHLKEAAKNFNTNITDISLSEGINGLYYIECSINGIKTYLPVKYERCDNNYQITIGGITSRANPVTMDINFTKDGLLVNTSIPDYSFSDYRTYKFNDLGIVERSTTHKNELVSYKKELLEKSSMPSNLPIIDNSYANNLTWYLLPWNARYGISLEEMQLSKDNPARIITKDLIYVDGDDNFFIKDILSKYYKKKKTGSEEVVLDSLDKEITGIKHDNGYLIETSFSGNAIIGFYKTNLLGNHFYHVSKSLDKNNLNMNNLISLDSDRVVDKADLLDIKKYVKDDKHGNI